MQSRNGRYSGKARVMGGSNLGRFIGLPAGFFAVFLVIPVKVQDIASIGPRPLALKSFQINHK